MNSIKMNKKFVAVFFLITIGLLQAFAGFTQITCVFHVVKNSVFTVV